MRYSQMFIPTVKEVPSDEHRLEKQLLIRAGMERRVFQNTGIRLPLGIMELDHIDGVVNEAFKNISVQKIDYITDSELTHVDMVTALIRGDLKSYKHLPKTFAFGKETKNIFSFCSEEALDHCGLVGEALDKLRLDYIKTEDNEIYGVGLGDEPVIRCQSCNYAKHQSKATSYKESNIEDGKELFKDYTPEVSTIEDLSVFYKEDGDKFAKSLLVQCEGEVVLAMVPGTRALSMVKLAKYLGVDESSLTMADDLTVNEITGAQCGFAGPINLKQDIRIIVDSRLQNISNLYVGANETDYHLVNVNYGRDFVGEIADCLIEIEKGNSCPVCQSPLSLVSAIEISKTVDLGNNYNEKNYVEYLDREGKAKRANCIKTVISQGAILDGIVAQNNDGKGIVYQEGQGAFDLIITIVNMKSEEQKALGEELYVKAQSKGMKVLLDDRDERAGMKFNDGELLGIHKQVVVGKLAGEGKVEFAIRGEEKTTVTVEELDNIL